MEKQVKLFTLKMVFEDKESKLFSYLKENKINYDYDFLNQDRILSVDVSMLKEEKKKELVSKIINEIGARQCEYCEGDEILKDEEVAGKSLGSDDEQGLSEEDNKEKEKIIEKLEKLTKRKVVFKEDEGFEEQYEVMLATFNTLFGDLFEPIDMEAVNNAIDIKNEITEPAMISLDIVEGMENEVKNRMGEIKYKASEIPHIEEIEFTEAGNGLECDLIFV
jgi:hypothetical protein